MLFSKISDLCNDKGITIWKLEKVLGLGNATIRKWETAMPSVDKVQKVADYFGVSIDYLLDRKSKIELSADSKIIAISFDSLPPEKQELVKRYIEMLKVS